MVRLDGLLEGVLAVAGLVLAVNVAFAVLVWLYALLVLGGSVVAILLGLAFIGLGTVIVLGFVQVYLGREPGRE